jgi:hypothetical protein
MRGTTRISFDDDAFQRLEAGDIVIAIARHQPGTPVGVAPPIESG